MVRQSTDTRATDDPLIAKALKFIRACASDNISVNTVARAAGVGRRDLERSFRRSLNCSVLDEIRSVRVARVKELLAQTTLSMDAIAIRCGFSTPSRMTIVFRQITGMSPSAYLRKVLSQSGQRPLVAKRQVD